jgi:multiple antibiotic resistance protein
MLSYFIKVFVSFLVIMNPVSVIPVFLQITAHEVAEVQRKIALKATITAGGILLVFAVVGDWLLTQLEISPGALLIAGGVLLLIFAIRRVLGADSGSGRTPSESERAEAQNKRDSFVFPLAIPLIAGPGALTVVTFQMKQVAGDLGSQGLLILALLMVLAINGVLLIFANTVGRALGVTGTNVITRVFGIILAAIAAQLILNGITTFWKTAQLVT